MAPNGRYMTSPQHETVYNALVPTVQNHGDPKQVAVVG